MPLTTPIDSEARVSDDLVAHDEVLLRVEAEHRLGGREFVAAER